MLSVFTMWVRMFTNTCLLLIITPKRCWHLRPHSECRLRGHIWTYWADFQRLGQIISRRSRFWHQICNKMWFSSPLVKIMAFRVETKTGGHMARIARNDPIFNAFCRERRGEADSGHRFGFLLCSDFSEQFVLKMFSGWIRDDLEFSFKVMGKLFLGLAENNNLGIL